MKLLILLLLLAIKNLNCSMMFVTLCYSDLESTLRSVIGRTTKIDHVTAPPLFRCVVVVM